MSDTIVCRTEQEYKSAVRSKAKRIRIVDAELARKTKLVLRIPKFSFVMATALAGAAVASVHAGVVAIVAAPVTGGVSAAGGAILFGGGASTLVPIVGIVGVPAALAMVTLAIALGGVGMLKSLYNEYRLIDSGPSFALLQRK